LGLAVQAVPPNAADRGQVWAPKADINRRAHWRKQGVPRGSGSSNRQARDVVGISWAAACARA